MMRVIPILSFYLTETKSLNISSPRFHPCLKSQLEFRLSSDKDKFRLRFNRFLRTLKPDFRDVRDYQ